jgi:mannosyl-3-phosphoglycerate phosphatase
VLAALRDEYQFVFRGFNDIQLDELVALTELSEEQAKLSKQREASEPLLWKDTDDALEYFGELLKKEDLIITKGGRFYHVMSDINKGESINWLFKKYQEMEPDTDWITIGLGDSYNDIEMLESVDYPVLITNPGTKQPELSDINTVYKTRLPGPQGWNEAVIEILDKIV